MYHGWSNTCTSVSKIGTARSGDRSFSAISREIHSNERWRPNCYVDGRGAWGADGRATTTPHESDENVEPLRNHDDLPSVSNTKDGSMDDDLDFLDGGERVSR